MKILIKLYNKLKYIYYFITLINRHSINKFNIIYISKFLNKILKFKKKNNNINTYLLKIYLLI